MTGAQRNLRMAVMALLFGVSASWAVGASAVPEAVSQPSIGDRIIALEHKGNSHPRDAAASLDRLLGETAPRSPERLQLLGVRGLLLATGSAPEAAERVAQSLDAWGPGPNADAAAATALLVRARSLANGGNLRRAAALAASAMERLPADAAPITRLRFVAAQAKILDDAGKIDEAVRLYHEALGIADQLGEAWRRAEVRSRLAYAYYEAKQMDRARSLNQEAMAIATKADDAMAIAHSHNVEGVLLAQLGDHQGERRETQLSIEWARRAGARAEESRFLANLADSYLKDGEYKIALTLSEEALPLTRDLKDVDGEVVALANMGLAHISMKNFEQGKRLMAQAIAIDEARGSMANVSSSLLEMAGYLEKAGDMGGAVQAYHRHRELDDAIFQRDQQNAIVEMQERFDAERRTRDLALLHRESELKTEQLRQRDLQQQLWGWLAAVCTLSLVVLVLLYQRVRRSNHALASSNFQLLVQSESDPLTGLSNRRHFQAAMQQLAADGKLEGTVFLIDIDHFKRINDAHGHSVGDTVLTEMARRLRDTVRQDDLVVRWGGEEFLIIVRALSPEQVQALAERMLQAMAGTPVVHDGGVVAVTGSIGFATFPIQPTALSLSWERAINLVDTAMYLAKAHGRNRAYGVRLLHARDESQLDEITRSLESAWGAGHVVLTLLQGPSPGVRVAA